MQRPLLFLGILASFAGCGSAPADAEPRRPADIVGRWAGSAEFRGAFMPITVRFERVNGLLSAFLTAPEIGLLEQRLSDVAHDSSHVYFSLGDQQGDLVFQGRQRGDTIAGEAQLSRTLAAREGAGAMAWRVVRDTVPPPPAPYTRRALRLTTQGAVLAATLTIPRRAVHAPAVLILQGSSSNLREEYAFYVDRFARAGFVVLAFDKRGNGESTGDYRRASYDDLVFDARTAFDTLASQREVDPDRIGIWGLSQGAFIAPRVAEGVARKPAFVVAVSSPGLSIAETAAYQDSLRVAWEGGPVTDAARAASVHRTLARAIRSNVSSDSLASIFRSVAGEPWRRFTSMPRTPPELSELRGWYWYGRTLDPVDWWRRLHVPALLIYGEADELVPAHASAARLTRTLRDAGNSDVTVRVYPGANHVIKQVHSPLTPAASTWDWPRLAPRYVEEMVAWMREKTG